jgi:hypothetical protein
MSESTLQRPPASERESAARPPSARAWRLPGRPQSAAYLALVTGAALLVLSLLLVLWARTRPGFDPYGWLVWGHQTIHGSLDTNAAPSWKPLPYLFTVPYALFGHYELWLWMVTSVAISLSGAIFAARIAYRLTAAPERRYAGVAAGAFAGLALLGMSDYWHYILSAQSDPMIVALILGAIDCHLCRRYKWAFALVALACLGRPEVWPFAALYAIWAWRALPSMRWLIYAGLAVIVLLWFGIPTLTSRTPFVAASNALGSGRALHNDKVFGTIHRFLSLHQAPLELLALLSVVIAFVRRDRVTLALAAGAVGWVVVEIAFALHGWPGLARYMFEAAGVMVVIAAIGVGRLLADAPSISRAAGWVAVALVLIVVGALVPPAISHARAEHKDIKVQRARTDSINHLVGTISRLGGPARLASCGEPLTRLEYQTILAYQMRVNVSAVGFKYGQAIAHGNPIVLFTPVAGGWKVQAIHQRASGCLSLPH